MKVNAKSCCSIFISTEKNLPSTILFTFFYFKFTVLETKENNTKNFYHGNNSNFENKKDSHS